MQTLQQQKKLAEWSAQRHGRRCRFEDTEADRACMHREPGCSLLAIVIGCGLVIIVLSSIGVI